MEEGPSAHTSTKRRFNSLNINFQSKVKDIQEADASRCLYSLTKLVREVAVYPVPFKGRANENIFKFKEKFFDALEANQVHEKDKI